MSTYRAGQPSVTLLARCRELRQHATDAEALLWSLLRGRQLGVKFRRQHQFGPYILDFYCPACRLVVEADGGQHGTDAGMADDAARTRFLAEHGLRVLRFTNREILRETEAVLQAIWQAVSGGEG